MSINWSIFLSVFSDLLLSTSWCVAIYWVQSLHVQIGLMGFLPIFSVSLDLFLSPSFPSVSLLSFHCSFFFFFCRTLIEVPPSISKACLCPLAQPWDKWVMHKLHQPKSRPRRRHDSESTLGGIISSCFLSDGIKFVPCLFCILPPLVPRE